MSDEKKTAYARFLDEFNKNTVTDRLDYPYILLESLRLINLLRVDPDYDKGRVDEAIQTLCDMIPESARDPQFKEELEKAHDIVKIDITQIFLGRKVGPPKYREDKVMNPSRQLHAIVDLVDRMSLGLKTENKGFIGRKNEE